MSETGEVDILKLLEKDAASGIPDTGISDLPEDNLVPYIYILQPLSPQVQKKQEGYIEGAEPGDIWLRNLTPPIVKGEEGFIFQFCHFWKNFVEFIPRSAGGGFVAAYDEPPNGTVEVVTDNVKRLINPEKNTEIIEYRYHAGLVHRGLERHPFIIPLKSTGHTTSKTLMPLLRKFFPNSTVRSKSYHTLIKMTTVHMQNKKGQWFSFKVEDLGWVKQPEDIIKGLDLQQSLVSGTRQAEQPLIEHLERQQIDEEIPF